MTGISDLAPSPAPTFPPGARILCPLLMAGDPTLKVTRRILRCCVDAGVGMVELCVPFENAFTDGQTLIRAHARALEGGTGLLAALDLAAEFSDRIRIILLADSSHTLRPHGFDTVCTLAQRAGIAGILPHGLPPALLQQFHTAARGRVATVGTIYPNSRIETRRRVIAQASAFIYLVSAYGRSGGTSKAPDLGPEIAALHSKTDLPIALGFGLKTGADVAGAFGSGCDIAIVGSAVSAALEDALIRGEDPVNAAADLIETLNRAAMARPNTRQTAQAGSDAHGRA